MKNLERTILYIVLGVLTVAVFRPGNILPLAAASPDSVRKEPVNARIATCDVYSIMRTMIDGEEFKPARAAIEERIRTQVGELREIEAALKSSDPKDEEAQAKYQEFVSKRKVFEGARTELDLLMGRQFVQVYERIKAAADVVAVRQGYTHVVASRNVDDPPTNDPDRLTQAILSRPMLFSPEGDDVTNDVVIELNLVSKP